MIDINHVSAPFPSGISVASLLPVAGAAAEK